MQSEKRRTIVFVECAAAMGGVQFSTLYLAQNLNPAQWKPVVVCPEEGDLTRACGEAGIETHVLAQPRLWSTSIRIGGHARLPNPFAWIWNVCLIGVVARQLKRFLVQRSPDLVVTKGLSSHFTGGLAAHESGIPCVWHVQDLISERSFGVYRRIFGLAARRLPHYIIVDGAAIAQQLPRSLGSRISVIHNGVDTELFRPGLDGTKLRQELGIPENHLVIGHAARITPWKGQHYLIEAFARIADEHPNVTVLIVGAPVFDNDSYQNELHRMTAELGLQDRIKFAGYRHDLPNVLAAMDVFAFTSIEKDTSPLALLSAMASGLPIVAFDIDGVRELIDDDKQLLRVPVGQTDDLAKSLRRLISGGQLRSTLALSARQLAERKFSLKQNVDRIENVLLRVNSRSPNLTTEEIEDSGEGRRLNTSSATPAKTTVASPLRS
jgi:glycosyltransferase involved in cell wall biosynthesis